MRIALISDVHANLEALRVLTNELEQADQVICLGDLTGYYCQVNEVLDFVRALNPICVLGNHDYYVLAGTKETLNPAVQFGIDYANSVIDSDHRLWLEKQPTVWAGILDGISLLCCHGSPWDPLNGYLYENKPEIESLGAFRFDYLAFGQTHRPYLRDKQWPALINPGSVGQSRHENNRACMATIDTLTKITTMISIPYDPGIVMLLARQNGAKEWITKHLG